MDDAKRETTSDIPLFYTYRDKDGWKRTDDALTRQINRAFIIVGDLKFETAKYSFYPQWGKPNDLNELRVAWRITADGYKVARWEWKTCNHKSSHRDCKPNGDGTCQRRVLIRLHYDQAKKLWIRDE